MKPPMSVPKTVAGYIATLPANVRSHFTTLRATVRKAVPEAEEAISYRIVGWRLGGRYFLYLAGFANHLSLYPAPRGDPALAKAMAPYFAGKATLRFPLDQPIPVALITRVVRFMVKAHGARYPKTR